MSNSNYMDWVMNDGYGAPIFRPRQRPAGTSGPPPGPPPMSNMHALTLPPHDPMNKGPVHTPRKQRHGEKMKISPRYIPCKFHTSPGGCKVGDKCHYYHADIGLKLGSKSRPYDPPKFGNPGPALTPSVPCTDKNTYSSAYEKPGPHPPYSHSILYPISPPMNASSNPHCTNYPSNYR
jgi:hypothetical protein